MRKTLKSSAEVFHFWANQVQPEGKSGNVYFKGPNVYSYGAHFCIARILPSGTVVFTTRTYSPTTSGHVSEARQAASHRAIVYCNDPTDSAMVNMNHARKAISDALANSGKPRIRQTTRDGFKAQAVRIAEQANAYLSALPQDERGTVAAPIDMSTLEQVRADAIAAEQAAARIRAGQQAARVADLSESLAQWRAHEIVTRTGLYELPPALRLSKDGAMVQTSRGAEIPVADALKLWPMVRRAMRGGRDWVPGEALGVYRLTRIHADGSIVVGCHTIAFAELERMADALGLTETA